MDAINNEKLIHLIDCKIRLILYEYIELVEKSFVSSIEKYNNKKLLLKNWNINLLVKK